MHELRKLFEGVKHPSVRIFRERIACFSPEKQTEYYHIAFFQTLYGFDGHSERFRTFFSHLVRAHRQEYMDFLHEKTILGSLRYRLDDGELFRKIVYSLERTHLATDASRMDLLFSLILAFDYDLKISAMNQYMKTDILDSADLAELLEKIHRRYRE